MAHKTSMKIAQNPSSKAADTKEKLSRTKIATKASNKLQDPTPGSTAKIQKAPSRPSIQPKTQSKKEAILILLRSKKGATIKELATATGWQAHSVRGFLAGTVKKKLELTLNSEKPDGNERRYFVQGRA